MLVDLAQCYSLRICVTMWLLLIHMLVAAQQNIGVTFTRVGAIDNQLRIAGSLVGGSVGIT